MMLRKYKNKITQLRISNKWWIPIELIPQNVSLNKNFEIGNILVLKFQNVHASPAGIYYVNQAKS
jgi:hypothetical protein